jgi:hypothetical protein
MRWMRVVVAGLSMLAIVGCAGGAGNTDAKESAGPASATAGSPAPQARTNLLTQAELQRAGLARGDLDGYQIEPWSGTQNRQRPPNRLPASRSRTSGCLRPILGRWLPSATSR